MKHMEQTLLIPSLLEKPTSKLHSKERLLEKMDWELRHKARGGKAGFLPRDECWHAPVPQQRRTFPSCSCSISPAAEPLPARSAEPAGAQSSKWRELGGPERSQAWKCLCIYRVTTFQSTTSHRNACFCVAIPSANCTQRLFLPLVPGGARRCRGGHLEFILGPGLFWVLCPVSPLGQ